MILHHPPRPRHTVGGFVIQLRDLTPCPSFLSRPGRLLQMFCTPESLERLRRTLVSVCALCAGCFERACFTLSLVVDTNEVRSAFDVLMQCRMLPMLLESFVGASLFNDTTAVPKTLTQLLEEMRRNQYLITNDVERYMAEYEVRYAPPPFFFTRQQELRLRLLQASGDPDVIGRLVLLLAEWYFAWAPGGEYVSSVRTHVVTLFHPVKSQSVQVRSHHLVRLHRQFPHASILRPTGYLSRRIQKAPRRDARVLHRGRDAQYPCVRSGLQTVAVLRDPRACGPIRVAHRERML